MEQLELANIDTDANLFRIPWAIKKACYEKHIKAVGGKTEGSGGMPLQRGQVDEPFCFWNMSVQAWGNVISSYFANLVVDLSPGDGNLMWACLLQGATYIGICFTEAHRDLLRDRVKGLYRRHMVDPSPDFRLVYNSRYAAAIANAKQLGDTAIGDGEPEPAPKLTPKKRSPTKKKATRKKSAKHEHDRGDVNGGDAPINGNDDDDGDGAADGSADSDDAWDPLAVDG